jgi:uncharacterized protein (UPF0335 family)
MSVIKEVRKFYLSNDQEVVCLHIHGLTIENKALIKKVEKLEASKFAYLDAFVESVKEVHEEASGDVKDVTMKAMCEFTIRVAESFISSCKKPEPTEDET